MDVEVEVIVGNRGEKIHSLSEREANMVEEARNSESIPQEEAKKMIGMD